MLALTRLRNQKIRIGPDIWVVVIDAAGGQVKLGIEAPREVSIMREENLPKEERFDAVRSGNHR